MIHLVHTLGGCGGTLLTRCLGVLPGAAVLSEVNPAAVNLYPHFHPLYQDGNWLHLLSVTDREQFASLDLSAPKNFQALITVFHQRAAEAGRHLIVRDFNYIDFIGVPFDSAPPRRLTIHDALPAGIPVRSVALIRYPLDQWRSLCGHEELRASLTPEIFCDAYAAFLEALLSDREAEVAIYKYEEFIQKPEQQMHSICDDLALPFEPAFLEKFCTFDSVTGDYSRLKERAISPPPRRPIAPEVHEAFQACRSFSKVLEKTGYSEGDLIL